MSNWQELKGNPRLRRIFEQRIKIIRAIREFFWSAGFAEAETPVAVRYASQEPYLSPLTVTIHDPIDRAERFYLHTSPEYALKKLLGAGFGKLFEITKCFRDYESFGGNHNPEFTMLEWYRCPGRYQNFMADMEELFAAIGRKLGVDSVTYRGKKVSIAKPWDRISVKELWRKYVGVNLDDYLEQERLEDYFFKISLNEIEPHLGLERPVFVYDYPASLASLSRRCADDPRYAERAECYVGGLEIANGFGELTDADDQQTRLEKDRRLKTALGKETWPIDADFIAALRSIPSPAAGIALGVDRMVLLFTGARDINEVIFESIADQLS